MTRTTLALVAAFALPALACCGPSDARAAPQRAAAPTERGKLDAPVVVEAALDAGTAHVTVRFASPATDIRVDVSGVDGLTVTSAATPIQGASYDRGAVASFDVAYAAGPGRSHLAVAVSGAFPGGRRATVASFAVGTPSAEQQKAATGVVEESDGERVKIVIPRQ
jgi:hypothetical protein